MQSTKPSKRMPLVSRATDAARWLALVCALLAGSLPVIAWCQKRLPPITTTPQLPEPIYWKQDLFLVPYQWGSAAEAGAAQAVWLFVSKDQGASWNKISEARPHVTSFNYRAEGDGEYWFAVRTIDNMGRAWPEGPYHPELRVIVDTSIPQINQLSARQFDSGHVEIVWNAWDPHLDSSSLRIEAQMTPGGAWLPVAVQSSGVGPPYLASWQLAAGVRPEAVRVYVSDRAGNTATYLTQVIMAPPGSTPTPFPAAGTPAMTQSSLQSPPAEWISTSQAANYASSAPTHQPWPASQGNRSPFRLFGGGPVAANDAVTSYGSVPQIIEGISASESGGAGDPRFDGRFAGPVVRGASESHASPPAGGESISQQASSETQPNFTPLEPFRQVSVARLPMTSQPEGGARDQQSNLLHTPPGQPKLVGSRTFALEYDLDGDARWGVTNVTLWGTRDGGRTWHTYARDDDRQSPLVVTVGEEGLYGFRIVVECAGVATQTPTAGDEPELWVQVDLRRPVIELTGLERGSGNFTDHLILRWRAVDDNLESRPIALFYSSRPGGPWSAIATNLENTGQYAWRVERHVPSRFYLRLEARDTAGNMAAFQTREPLEFESLVPSAQLLDAEPIGPTASGSEAYRY